MFTIRKLLNDDYNNKGYNFLINKYNIKSKTNFEKNNNTKKSFKQQFVIYSCSDDFVLAISDMDINYINKQTKPISFINYIIVNDKYEHKGFKKLLLQNFINISKFNNCSEIFTKNIDNIFLNNCFKRVIISDNILSMKL